MNKLSVEKKLKIYKITFEVIFWLIFLALLICAILVVSIENENFKKIFSYITMFLTILNTPLVLLKIRSATYFLIFKRKLLKQEQDKIIKKQKKEKIEMLNKKEKKMKELLKQKNKVEKVSKHQAKINIIKKHSHIIGLELEYNNSLAVELYEYYKNKNWTAISIIANENSDVKISKDSVLKFIKELNREFNN